MGILEDILNDLPIALSNEEIKESLNKERAKLKKLEDATKAIRLKMKYIADLCPHKKTKSYNDRSGVSCTYCQICGKEW